MLKVGDKVKVELVENDAFRPEHGSTYKGTVTEVSEDNTVWVDGLYFIQCQWSAKLNNITKIEEN